MSAMTRNCVRSKSKGHAPGAMLGECIVADQWNPESVIGLLIPNMESLPTHPSSLVRDIIFHNFIYG